MKNRYEKLSITARLLSLICACVAGGGAFIGFTDMTGNPIIAGLIGGGVALILGFGWHFTLHAAEHSRRGLKPISTLAVAGVLLVCIALATSGWSLATALGGRSALAHAQAAALSAHASALTEAKDHVDGQSVLINKVRQAAAASHLLGGDEGRSGQGPRFRSYLRTEANLITLADNMQSDLTSKAAPYVKQGEDALAAGRAALGTDAPFAAAMADAEAAVGSLSAIDISRTVLDAGLVTVNDKGLPQLDPITKALYTAADAAKPTPVVLESYVPMTRSQATSQFADTIIPAWVAAVGIDVAPFLLLILMLVLAGEPLLRAEVEPKHKVTAEEIRVADANVIGLRRSAGE